MKKLVLSVALLAGLIVANGCEQSSAPKADAGKKGRDVAKVEPKAHDHSGWWCDEHGVVEEECSICQKEVFKKLKPDEICAKHPDRAKAQCFICNPELWEKSAATYKAKYGKEPPEPTANKAEKK